MRIRISKKTLIAAGIAGSVLLCGALFKMTTDNGVIKNHEVAHMGTEHSGLSDAVVDLLGGNKEEVQNTIVEVDANADAAVLAGVTMSADDTDANVAAPAATAETQVQEEVPAQAPAVEAATQTAAPAQETVATPATSVVEEAAPVEEVVENVQTVVVSTPVKQEVVTTVQVPVEETVVEEIQMQSFKGALGGNAGAGVDEAMKNIETPEFVDDDGADERTGGDESLIFY